jgi:hypothetical protein
MSLLSLFDKPSDLARLIDECTSEMQLNSDIAMNLQVCDQVNRGGTGSAKDAIKTIRKKLKSSASNPKTSLLTLTLLEMLMKNCRAELHLEASDSAFLKDLEELATSSKTDVRVRDKILELIQSWADAFNAFKDDLPMFDALYVRMKRQGVSFPDRDLSGTVPILSPDGSRTTRMLPPQMDDTDSFGRSIPSSAQPQFLTGPRVPAASNHAQASRSINFSGSARQLVHAAPPVHLATPTFVALPPSYSQPMYHPQLAGHGQLQPAPTVPRPYQYQNPLPDASSFPPQGYFPQQSRVPPHYASNPAQVDQGSSWLHAAHGRQPAAATDGTRSATLASLKEFIASCIAASELYASLLAAGDSSDLIQDLRAQCTSLQDRLSKTIPEIQNEELLLQALSTNDEMLAVLMGKSSSSVTTPAVSQREGNLLGFDVAPSAAVVPAGGDAFMDELFRSNTAASSHVSQTPALPPGWEVLFDQRGQRFYGHPGMKITQYQHPSQGVVQPATLPPPPPFRNLQQQPMHAVQQPMYHPSQSVTQLPVHSQNPAPTFHAAPEAASAHQTLQPASSTVEPSAAATAVPVVSMDIIPGETRMLMLPKILHGLVYSIAHCLPSNCSHHHSLQLS